MRERIKLLEQTVKLFAEAQKHPAATKTAAELSRWRQALAKLIAATYPAKRYRPTPLIYKGIASSEMVCRQFSPPNESRNFAREGVQAMTKIPYEIPTEIRDLTAKTEGPIHTNSFDIVGLDEHGALNSL